MKTFARRIRTAPARCSPCAAAACAGCAVGPAYAAPGGADPAAFKEGARAGSPAAPADALERGPWWTLFGDPVLDELAAAGRGSNQNVAAAVAAYAQARALVAQQRASLFPTVDAERQRRATARGGGGSDGRRAAATRSAIGGSWEPDVWGRLRARRDAAQASAQASAADLAAGAPVGPGRAGRQLLRPAPAPTPRARCSAQTIEGYQRDLQITSNRYDAGIVARTDVLQAQTQLANAAGRRARACSASAPSSNTRSRCWWARRRPTSRSRRRAGRGRQRAAMCRRRAVDAAAAPARHRRRRAPGGARQRADRHRARGLLPEPRPDRLGRPRRGRHRRPVQRLERWLWSLGAVGRADPVRRRRHAARRSTRRRAASSRPSARYRQTVLTAFAGRRGPAGRHARAGAAAGPAPAGLARPPTRSSRRC